MNHMIDLPKALRQLPLEGPAHSAWDAVQSHIQPQRVWPKWPLALAASATLVAVLWRMELPNANSAKREPTTYVSQSPLQQSMARSVQLEPYFYEGQDDSISSASVIAANLNLEARLNAIDARLQEQPNETEALALWRERVSVLDQGIALNRANAQKHDDGQNFDLVLASLN